MLLFLEALKITDEPFDAMCAPLYATPTEFYEKI